jgi:hypothetical protein
VSRISQLSPQTARKVIGVGVLIQIASLFGMFQMWRHHRQWYYLLPLSLIGILLATVPAFLSTRSSR